MKTGRPRKKMPIKYDYVYNKYKNRLKDRELAYLYDVSINTIYKWELEMGIIRMDQSDLGLKKHHVCEVRNQKRLHKRKPRPKMVEKAIKDEDDFWDYVWKKYGIESFI